MVSVDSSTIELTDAQKAILTELLNMHNKRDNGPIKGKDIAAAIERSPGTIRTQMQSLKSLQLVKGIPGPKGGYEPTTRAYEVIDLERSGEYAPVPIQREDDPLDDVTVTELDLINLNHPDRHEAEVYVQGSIRQFHEGDAIVLGPTPAEHLTVVGTVDGVETSENLFLLSVEDFRLERPDE